MKRLLAALALLAAAGCASQPPPRPQPHALSAAQRQTFARIVAQYDADIATLRRAQRGELSAGLARRLQAGERAADAELRAGGERIAQPLQPPAQPPPDDRTAAVGPQTLRRFEAAEARRIERATALRAQQFREREADVAYDFERAHAGLRLTLDLKLHALHLAPADAAAYRKQLNALTQREETIVSAQRAKDRAQLAAYRSRLRAQAAGSAAALAREVRAVAAATSSVPAPRLRTPVEASSKRERSATAAAFATARKDVAKRYAQLRASHAAAQASLAAEISALEKERDALRAALDSAR